MDSSSSYSTSYPKSPPVCLTGISKRRHLIPTTSPTCSSRPFPYPSNIAHNRNLKSSLILPIPSPSTSNPSVKHSHFTSKSKQRSIHFSPTPIFLQLQLKSNQPVLSPGPITAPFQLMCIFACSILHFHTPRKITLDFQCKSNQTFQIAFTTLRVGEYMTPCQLIQGSASSALVCLTCLIPITFLTVLLGLTYFRVFPHPVPSTSGVFNRGHFAPEGISGNIWRHFLIVRTGKMVLASRKWTTRVCVNTLQERVQSLTTKNYPAQKVSSAAVKSSALHRRNSFPIPPSGLLTLFILWRGLFWSNNFKLGLPGHTPPYILCHKTFPLQSISHNFLCIPVLAAFLFACSDCAADAAETMSVLFTVFAAKSTQHAGTICWINRLLWSH